MAVAMVKIVSTKRVVEIRKSENGGVRRMKILPLLLKKDRGNPPSVRDG
jgi:hypothetical protein